MKTLICDCNRTMPLDPAALSKALGPEANDGLQTLHSTLCRREAPAFQRAAKSGDDLLVACTQESSLFLALNEQTEGAQSVAERPIRFVNIRETGGWSKDATRSMPKIAALIAAAQLPEPEPVPTVSYRSAGRALLIGPAEAAQRAAQMLVDTLEVTLLLPATRARPVIGRLEQQRTLAAHAGELLSLTGWLGAFEARWRNDNPIDLDLCTRCNACIEACPDAAIGFSYQIDLTKCGSHRACVLVCEAAGAIDFQRPPSEVRESFDLVLDLGATPHMSMHQPPQGYFHAPDDASLFDAVLRMRSSVGEFEKPKFFDYKQKLCAHSRNEQIGCSACIDVCSAQAIRSDASLKGKSAKRRHGIDSGNGAGIVVEPHLCVGCGACTTVCPTGAISYATPRPDEQGKRIHALLTTYQRAGGTAAAGAAALLFHSEAAGAALISELGRAARTDRTMHGMPARMLPVPVWHTASIGVDLWLAAIAMGASQIGVLMTAEEAPQYRAAVAEQMAVAQAVLNGLGLAGQHLRIVSATDDRTLDAALQAFLAFQRAPAEAVSRPASFHVQADKRATLELALDHLMTCARHVPDVVVLPARGSPFGSLQIDTAACTMCLSCVGACPSAALADNPDLPQLRFIEKNCVQCGLCAVTCPEQAITLVPRLWLADDGKARKQLRVLNEARPYACIRCGKAFGTLQAIESMLAKLAGHSMFQDAAADRLKMCGDCRVIDIHTNPYEVKITDI